MPNNTLGNGNTVMNKTHKNPCLHEAYMLEGETYSDVYIKYIVCQMVVLRSKIIQTAEIQSLRMKRQSNLKKRVKESLTSCSHLSKCLQEVREREQCWG